MNTIQPGSDRKKIFLLFLFAGLVVGSLDISSAFVDYYIATGKGPAGILKFVASGVFGKAAFSGGTSMAAWGLLFHYIIAFGWTAIFFLLYFNLAIVRKYPILSGICFAILVWFAMAFVVVPLSNIAPRPFKLANAVKAVSILVCMIGVPLGVVLKLSREK